MNRICSEILLLAYSRTDSVPVLPGTTDEFHHAHGQRGHGDCRVEFGRSGQECHGQSDWSPVRRGTFSAFLDSHALRMDGNHVKRITLFINANAKIVRID